MAKYHKYVFDTENRKFIGDFEKMYANEKVEVFDSWHQSDERQLNRKIALWIIENYNFDRILDVGCGKGNFTHLLKKQNNTVLGIDVSKTAIKIASEQFPDLDFKCFDLNENSIFDKLSSSHPTFDLVVNMETLSYLSNWKENIKNYSSIGNYLLITLFIPENPIGFVKSHKQLLNITSEYFEIIQNVTLNSTGFTILFGKSKYDDNET